MFSLHAVSVFWLGYMYTDIHKTLTAMHHAGSVCDCVRELA